jgi:hypothetical protein
MARFLSICFLMVSCAAAVSFGGDAALSTQPPASRSDWRLPSGTGIHMKLDNSLSTDRGKPGDKFSGHITQDVRLHGRTVIPAGASVAGQIIRVSAPRRIKGKPSITLRPEQITLPDGHNLRLSAMVVDTGNPRYFDVSDEGRIRGRGRDASDNLETLAATGAGAGVGAIAAGGAGALLGAGVGATITTAHWLLRHRSVEIPAGTELVLELSRPLALNSTP